MADVFDKVKRSEVMSRIKGCGNKNTELALMKIFRIHRITGWRRHQPLYGKPDFVFPAKKVAVFVDGCFWHGCPKHYKIPETNRDFWEKKIDANVKRDRIVNKKLKRDGWLIIRIWEHDIKNHKKITSRLFRVLL